MAPNPSFKRTGEKPRAAQLRHQAFKSEEIGMSVVQNKKRSGYLFLAGGCAFFLAAFFGKQAAFYGLGAMFLAIGASYLRKAKDS